MKTSVFKIIAIILCIAVSIVFSGATAFAAAAPSIGLGVSIGSSVGAIGGSFQSLINRFVTNFVFYFFGQTPTENIEKDLLNMSLENYAEHISNECDEYLITAESPDPNLAFLLELSENFPEAKKDSLDYILLKQISNICKFDNDSNLKINSQEYFQSVAELYKFLYPEQSVEIGIEPVNGIPQYVTTINQGSYISVFDTLGLEYTVVPSLFDFEFDILTKNSYCPALYYTPYFITSDNKLYLFQAEIYCGYNGDYNKLFYEFYSPISHSQEFVISYNFHYSGRFSFRFVGNRDHLYFCLLSSNYIPNSNTIYYKQYTNGRPVVSNAPQLFLDYWKGFEVSPVSVELDFQYFNYTMPDLIDISFVNSVDKTDILTDSEILSADIIAFGYFQGSKNSIRFDSSTLNTAGQMLLSDENVVSGGDKTITSDLTDWQKAIFVLAQQQGISFEEMLKKLDLIIDSNGEITLLGLDGLEYSVSELSKQFDKVIGSVEDIAGDLSKLLEYLKSLNIEGLEGYISSIERTLTDLNERDKDKAAVLGDFAGTLQDLKEILEAQTTDIKSIAEALTIVEAIEIDIELENFHPPGGITTKFPFSLPFDVYNIFNLLSADPVTPKFTIPFDFSSIGGEVYEINIDLSQFDYIANIVRWLLYGVFMIGLVLLTNKLIGRG